MATRGQVLKARAARGQRSRSKPFPLDAYAEIMRGMFKNPEHRNWYALDVLWLATYKYANKAWGEYRKVRRSLSPAKRELFDRAFEDFAVRFKNYRRVLDMKPSVATLENTVAREFLDGVPGQRVPDYVLPIMLMNKTDALIEAMFAYNKDFLVRTPIAVKAAIVKSLAAEEESGMLKWGVVVLGTVAAGAVAVTIARRK